MAMKFSIDIDCTPSEAREFFGLPDVDAFNQALVEKAQEQVLANMQEMDPEALMKTWMPAGTQIFEAVQKQFFSQTATNKKDD